MEFEYINYIVIFLLVIVTLNLFLTVKLMKAMRWQISPDVLREPLAEGSIIESFIATNQHTKSQIDFIDNDSARVFVFLHTGCPSCKERISDVMQAVELSMGEGVAIYLITTEGYKKCRAFLQSTDLLEKLLHVDKETYKKINPQQASPAYVFVNDENAVEAQGLIGDENWTGLWNS